LTIPCPHDISRVLVIEESIESLKIETELTPGNLILFLFAGVLASRILEFHNELEELVDQHML